MAKIEEEIDNVIDGIKIGLGTDDCAWSAIEAAVRVLETIKELRGNIGDISDEEFDQFILTAVGGY